MFNLIQGTEKYRCERDASDIPKVDDLQLGGHEDCGVHDDEIAHPGRVLHRGDRREDNKRWDGVVRVELQGPAVFAIQGRRLRILVKMIKGLYRQAFIC